MSNPKPISPARATPSSGACHPASSRAGDSFEVNVCMTPVLVVGGLFMACLVAIAILGAGCAFPGSTQVINIGWRSAQCGESNATNRVSSGADLQIPLTGGK